eukprot:gene22843-29017_t
MYISAVIRPAEIMLFSNDKSTAAKFTVVRDGSKPDPTAPVDAKSGKANGPLIQLLYLDSNLPAAIKKMMQGTKVTWEHVPVFHSAVSLSSNTTHTNHPFSAATSNAFAQQLPAGHNPMPYSTFTGTLVATTSNVNAPQKGVTLAPPPLVDTPFPEEVEEVVAPTAVVAVKGKKGKATAQSEEKPVESSSAETSKTADTEDAASNNATSSKSKSSLFAGVFKDRNKWVAVLEVDNSVAVAASDGPSVDPKDYVPSSVVIPSYDITNAVTTKQIFLGRYETAEEARHVYKKAESDLKTVGSFSKRRLAKYLKSIAVASQPTMSTSHSSGNMAGGVNLPPPGTYPLGEDGRPQKAVMSKYSMKMAAIKAAGGTGVTAQSGVTTHPQPQQNKFVPSGAWSAQQRPVSTSSGPPPAPQHQQASHQAQSAYYAAAAASKVSGQTGSSGGQQTQPTQSNNQYAASQQQMYQSNSKVGAGNVAPRQQQAPQSSQQPAQQGYNTAYSQQQQVPQGNYAPYSQQSGANLKKSGSASNVAGMGGGGVQSGSGVYYQPPVQQVGVPSGQSGQPMYTHQQYVPPTMQTHHQQQQQQNQGQGQVQSGFNPNYNYSAPQQQQQMAPKSSSQQATPQFIAGNNATGYYSTSQSQLGQNLNHAAQGIGHSQYITAPPQMAMPTFDPATYTTQQQQGGQGQGQYTAQQYMNFPQYAAPSASGVSGNVGNIGSVGNVVQNAGGGGFALPRRKQFVDCISTFDRTISRGGACTWD